MGKDTSLRAMGPRVILTVLRFLRKTMVISTCRYSEMDILYKPFLTYSACSMPFLISAWSCSPDLALKALCRRGRK